jgi:hypothetical protein
MSFRRNAKLGLAGRLALVRAIEDGVLLKAAAAASQPARAPLTKIWNDGCALRQLGWAS